MNKVYISSILGAPSPTAVIMSKEDVELLDWKKIAEETYNYLKRKEINFSKMAIISEKNKNSYKFKFVQIKIKDGALSLESNANCGNSMIASARVIYKLNEVENNKNISKVLITNVDTNLQFLIDKVEDSFNIEILNLKGKEIDSFKMFKKSEKNKIVIDDEEIEFSMVNAVNEYIIVNAENIGIKSKEALLSLNETDKMILPKVKQIRSAIKEKYNLDKESEFPKIAIVYSDGVLAARTVYLDGWHKGLPITGAITIMITSKMQDSVIYNKDLIEDIIETPKGEKNVHIELDDLNIIKSCLIYNVKSEGSIEQIL